MRKSIATVSLSGTLPEKLEAISAARFDAVEIFENDLMCFNGTARSVRQMADDLGLQIALYQPFRDFEGVDDTQFQRNLDRAERKFDVMEELGAPLILVCSNVSQATSGDQERIVAQLHTLAERAGKRGLRIGYEALAWGAHTNRFSQAWQIVKQANHPHLGIILDSFHTLCLKDDPAPIADIPGDKIFFLQLADAPRMSMDVLSWSRHFRCFPGQGDFDVASMVIPALQAGYSGPLSLEIFNDDFRSAAARNTAQDAMRSLLHLEEIVRHKIADSVPPIPVRTKVELFDPAPIPTATGVTFLEFTVDKDTEASLSALFTKLGFEVAGHHRSKEVTLYKQGGINFVLNADRDSFAHSYYLLHGVSICATALGVEDPAQALSRADAFGCHRFEGRVGPNERHIPAVRAPDGTLIYFTEGDFDFSSDFTLAPISPRSTGLKAIDHVAQAVPPEQFDTWLLFYRTVLGLQPEDIWILPDPYGLVRSRAFASANKTIRFPLNFSESRNTATARSVQTFSGAGVHHIALSTDDIFATVAELRAAGLALLPIPGNYYEDLPTRFEMDDALLSRLQQHGILYDRTPDGEFFHVYTQLFEDRFFFEIVQRNGNYQAYGAVNAPVRMAALAQMREGTSDVLAENL